MLRKDVFPWHGSIALQQEHQSEADNTRTWKREQILGTNTKVIMNGLNCLCVNLWGWIKTTSWIS